MASQFLIPHPNIPTADIGLPKLKEVTVKNNENFLALDKLLQEFSTSLAALDKAKAAADHTHEFAPVEHGHTMAEIDGLIETLELKAPLIHVHDQYLTEIPVHSHTEDQVDGLLAHLAEKSNIGHKHNIDDVYNLEESLGGIQFVINALSNRIDGVDTRIDGVDERIDGVDERIDGVDERIDGVVEDMAKVTSDETPEVDGDENTGAGVIGISDNAARADHRHPINKTSDPNNLKPDSENDGEGQIGDSLAYAMADHSHPLNVNNNDPASVVFSYDSASSGTSPAYARADHVHQMPKLTADKVFIDTSTVADALLVIIDSVQNLEEWQDSTVDPALTDHGNRISALESKFPPSESFVKSVLGSTGTNGVVGEEILGTTADKAAAGNHKHESHTDIEDWNTATENFLTEEKMDDYITKSKDFTLDEEYGTIDPQSRVAHSHWAEDIVVLGGSSMCRLDEYFQGEHIDGSKAGIFVSGSNGKWVKTNSSTGLFEVTEDQPVTYSGQTSQLSNINNFLTITQNQEGGYQLSKVEEVPAVLTDTANDIEDIGDTKALGDSEKAAPANHVHALPEKHNAEIKIAADYVQGVLPSNAMVYAVYDRLSESYSIKCKHFKIDKTGRIVPDGTQPDYTILSGILTV